MAFASPPLGFSLTETDIFEQFDGLRLANDAGEEEHANGDDDSNVIPGPVLDSIVDLLEYHDLSSQIPVPIVSLSVGATVDCTVSHVDGAPPLLPHSFPDCNHNVYIQPVTYTRVYQHLNDAINAFYGQFADEEMLVKSRRIGKIVVAKWPEDGFYYRARIIFVPSPDSVLVRFVDFGNTSFVSNEFVKRIVKRYDLDAFPSLAYRCVDEALVVAGVEAYTKAVDKKFLVARVVRTVIDRQEENEPLPYINMYELSETEITAFTNISKQLTDTVVLKTTGMEGDWNTPAEGENEEAGGGGGEPVASGEGEREPQPECVDAEAAFLDALPEEVDYVTMHRRVNPDLPVVPIFPLKPGGFLDCVVKAIDVKNWNANVFIQPDAYVDVFDVITAAIQKAYGVFAEDEFLADIGIGQEVMARFSRDGLFHRGRILQAYDSTRSTVRFIDFGDCETVLNKDCKQMLKKFKASVVPPLVFRCVDDALCAGWRRYMNTMQGKTLVARIVKTVRDTKNNERIPWICLYEIDQTQIATGGGAVNLSKRLLEAPRWPKRQWGSGYGGGHRRE